MALSPDTLDKDRSARVAPDRLSDARRGVSTGLTTPAFRKEAATPEEGAPVEISIVLPCLNEEEAIGGCITTLQKIIETQHLNAEILVVDNASTDRSAAIAKAHGARVVEQPIRGYGNAYLKGFTEARGKYIVMADADNTYDFNEVDAFVQPLREGYDLVMGNRFAGRMAKDAMTWSHRYIGNPILSGLLNFFFHTGIRDAHCGMRAFTKEACQRMHLRTGGMEFASEMVINASKAGLKIAERPIAYHPRIGDSKLHTFRDGWRHLRFMLLYSPTHLFLWPGLLLLLAGFVGLSVLLPGPLPLFGHRWDIHAMILFCLLTLLGYQILWLGLCARFYSLTEHLDGESDRLLQQMQRAFTLERGLIIGILLTLVGLAIDISVFVRWLAVHMGPMNEVRPALYAMTLIALGIETIFVSFFLSLLQIRKGRVI
jgi:glycosyltransferase involved in cell wall biosynthesis